MNEHGSEFGEESQGGSSLGAEAPTDTLSGSQLAYCREPFLHALDELLVSLARKTGDGEAAGPRVLSTAPRKSGGRLSADRSTNPLSSPARSSAMAILPVSFMNDTSVAICKGLALHILLRPDASGVEISPTHSSVLTSKVMWIQTLKFCRSLFEVFWDFDPPKMTGIYRRSPDSFLSFVRHVLTWPEEDFVKNAKYFTAYTSAKFLGQELPRNPPRSYGPRDPTTSVGAAILFKGPLRRWLASRISSSGCTPRNARLHMGILQGVKRGCAEVPLSYVKKSFLSHAEALTRVRPADPGKLAFATAYFDRFWSALAPDVKEFLPNPKGSATHLMKRSEGGQLGEAAALFGFQTERGVENAFKGAVARGTILKNPAPLWDLVRVKVQKGLGGPFLSGMYEVRPGEVEGVYSFFPTKTYTDLFEQIDTRRGEEARDWLSTKRLLPAELSPSSGGQEAVPKDMETPPSGEHLTEDEAFELMLEGLGKHPKLPGLDLYKTADREARDRSSMMYVLSPAPEHPKQAISVESNRSNCIPSRSTRPDVIDVDLEWADLSPPPPVPFKVERPKVTVQAIKEPIKVRLITKGNGLFQWFSTLFQKKMWDYLQTIPSLALTGKPLEVGMLKTLWSRTKAMNLPFTRWVSGDYSAATDNLKIDFTRAAFERFLCRLAVPEEQKVVARSVLYEQVLHYPSSPKAGGIRYSDLPDELKPLNVDQPNEHDKDPCVILPQRNGQLMGSVESFPILCVCNVVSYWITLEEYLGHEVDLKDLPVIVNGDDILFLSDDKFYALWKRNIAEFGFELSLGKNYIHDHLVMVNSEPYWFSLQEGLPTFRPLRYLNVGLLTGQAKVSGRTTIREKPICDYYNEVVGGASTPLRAHYRFLQLNREKITHYSQRGRYNLFLDPRFGGLGFEMPKELKAVFTPFQRSFGHFLRATVEDPTIGLTSPSSVMGVVSDEMSAQTPVYGQPVSIRYQRYVRHSDGSFSMVIDESESVFDPRRVRRPAGLSLEGSAEIRTRFKFPKKCTMRAFLAWNNDHPRGKSGVKELLTGPGEWISSCRGLA